MDAPLAWLGKALVVVGLAVAATGLLLWGLSRLGLGGGLPGDVVIRRGGWSLYFPIVTCLLLSVVVSLVLYLISAARR
jgi:hypothetical protein